ncbi:MAG: hypothetical protein IPI50_07565 [Saprospiraceae bacterium]|nr:hypothetical protein [Saprospiraceae bacterium]
MSQYRLWRHKFATAIQYVLQFATAIRYYFYRKDRSRRLRPTVVVCRSTAYGGINLQLRYNTYCSLQLRFDTIFIERIEVADFDQQLSFVAVPPMAA